MECISRVRPAVVVLALAMLPAAAAQERPATRSIYVCVDAAGNRITGDRVPAECADRPVRELNPDGSLKRAIDPPPTSEQRAARAAEEQRKRTEAERVAEQRRRDRALLETYSSAEQIEAARDRALAGRRAVVERAGQRKRELEQERKKLDKEAEFFANRELSETLKRAYADNDARRQTEERIMAEAQAEMQRVTASFDADARRYRELTAAAATAPAKAAGK